MTRRGARLFLAASLLALTASARAGETVVYGYDSLGRLVRVSRSGTVNAGVTADYSYDASDNRAAVTVAVPGPVPPPLPVPPPVPVPPSAPAPVFSIAGSTANEGSNLMFTITKTGATTSPFSVDYATSNGSAAAPGDYQPASGTITFLPGQTSATVTVATVADGAAEPAETLLMTLSAPTGGATLDPQGGQAAGTIEASAGVNAPPTALPDSFSIARCTAGSLNLLANDSDPQGDPLTLTAVWGQAAQQGHASPGSATSAAWAKVAQPGGYAFYYTVKDSHGASAQASVAVTVTGSGTGACE